MGFFNQFVKEGTKKSDQEEIVESICDLLNTKLSFGAYQKDLGMAAYSYPQGSGPGSKQIIKDMKHCLEKYETRIAILDIQPLPNPSPFAMKFVIQCKIQKVPHSFHLTFQNHFERGVS